MAMLRRNFTRQHGEKATDRMSLRYWIRTTFKHTSKWSSSSYPIPHRRGTTYLFRSGHGNRRTTGKSESTRERRKRRGILKSHGTIMSRSFIILWCLPVTRYSCRGCMSFPAGAFRTGAHTTERSTSKSG